jgi:TonB family protein
LGTDHGSAKDPNKDAEIGYFGSRPIPGRTGDDNGAGGASDVPGTVASAGDGNGAAVPAYDPVIPLGDPKKSVFASSADESESPKPKADDTAAVAVQPLVILDKPSPVYTEEARRLAIEGEVLIEVVFSASGQVHIVRVVKGLGHGLDEAATSAVQQIRFQPALQNGQPVDVPATVHITFQLAF